MLTQGRVLTETVDNLTKNSASLVGLSFGLRSATLLLSYGVSQPRRKAREGEWRADKMSQRNVGDCEAMNEGKSVTGERSDVRIRGAYVRKKNETRPERAAKRLTNQPWIWDNFPGHSVGSLWSPLSFINLLAMSGYYLEFIIYY